MIRLHSLRSSATPYQVRLSSPNGGWNTAAPRVGIPRPTLPQQQLPGTTQMMRRTLVTRGESAAGSSSGSHNYNNKSGTALGRVAGWSQAPTFRLRRGGGLVVERFSVARGGLVSSSTSRSMSSDGKGEAKTTEANQKKTADGGDDESDSKELVLTPGEQVVVAGRLTMWAGIAIFALACAYYIGKELMPTKMSPNRVFDRSFAVLRQDPEIQRRYGDTVKAYGRDHGGHREGRRNFVEHSEYTDPTDQSKRTRVRYNLESRTGRAFVFAEVSNQMPSGEFVYILVQDKATGRVHTVVDNRAALTAARLAGGNQQAQSAMAQLLGGGGKN